MLYAFGFHRQGFRHSVLRWLSTLLILLTCSTIFAAAVDAQALVPTATYTAPPLPTTPLRVYTKLLEPFVMGTGDQLRGFSVEWHCLAYRQPPA